MTVSNKESLSYWSSVKLEDIIQLKDEQTISFLMDEGCENLTHGADFTIKRKRGISAQEGKAEWIILDIEYTNFTWTLIIKSNGADFDSFIYYAPDGFVDGDRNDIIENADWLMEVWEEGTELKDLSFAKEIQQGEDTIFKTSGPQYGTCFEDGDKSFATVVEYITESEDEENPLMTVIEFNQIEEYEESNPICSENEFGDIEIEGIEVEKGVNINEDSSYIMLLQGCSISVGDIDVLRI